MNVARADHEAQDAIVEGALEFSAVFKSFRQQPVLQDINLTVRPGEFLGLVGVNGAGKTTLIKSLLDFCDIDSGLIRIFGISHRQTVARSRLAYLPEQFMPPYFATGGEFLTYMGRLHGVRNSRDNIEKMLRTLDLAPEALVRPVRQLSKGMAQKLGLAATFLSGKEMLILDEPTSGLDPKARALLKHHLLALKESGHGLFFSTHMLADVEILCDRIAILHELGLRYVGSPDECIRQYGASSLEEAYLACIGGLSNADE